MFDLLIDLGGTKIRMTLAKDQEIDWQLVKDIPADQHDCLESAIMAYLNEIDFAENSRINGVSVGIAGPVTDTDGEVTNLGWIVNANTLRDDLSKFDVNQVKLLNDLEAFAWGIIALEQDQLAVINPGKNKKGNKAVVAAGTGLGMAGIISADSGQLLPFATEGGHSTFTPRKKDKRIMDYLSEKYDGHVSFERVVSGKYGFKNLFEVFADDYDEDIVSAFTNMHKSWGSRTSQLAREENPLALKIMDTFLYYYGVAASNFALMQKATAGVYIAGGIAPKIKDFILARPSFMDGFLYKGRFREFLSEIPIYLVEADRSALMGCLNYLRNHRNKN